MMKVQPKFVYDEDGKKVGVVLTQKDFDLFIDVLEDFHDLRLIQERRKIKQRIHSSEEVKAELFRTK